MRVVLDTSILLHLTRSNSPFVSSFREMVLVNATIIAASAVSMGELSALALRNQWGASRMAKLEGLMDNLLIIPVESQELIAAYAKLDVYSQGKLPGFPLPSGVSARNMGKNDLWIAATALVLEAALVTADADFAHLAPLVKVSRIN